VCVPAALCYVVMWLSPVYSMALEALPSSGRSLKALQAAEEQGHWSVHALSTAC